MTSALRRLETDPPTAPVSFEEFLAWAPDDVQAEWVDGDVLIMSPASTEHQRLHGLIRLRAIRVVGDDAFQSCQPFFGIAAVEEHLCCQ